MRSCSLKINKERQVITTRTKGRQKWVPATLLDEIDSLKREENLRRDNEAFGRIVEYTRVGREVKKMRDKFFMQDMFGRRMNRKGTVQDVGVAMVFFFVAVILFFVVTYAYDTMIDKITLTPGINSSQVTIDAFEDSQDLTNRLDYVAVVLLFGLTLAIIITGWFVAGNQLFAFIYLLVLIILIIVSAMLSYVWNIISSNATFTATLTKFPISDYILQNFPIFVTVIGFLGMMVMFSKPYFEGGQ